jgi:FkbM family methyltransferase
VVKSILRRYISTHPKLEQPYTAMMWQWHIVSDWCHTHILRAKKRRTTPHGFTLISKGFIANRMMLRGIFELAELDVLKSHLQSADVFVDVGANIGYYACLARSLGKHVVAIEPQAQNLDCLTASLADNGWSDVEVFPIGLSNVPGLVTLYGASGPSASLVRGWAGYSGRFKRVIPVNTLDNVLGGRFPGKRLVIKIDVEGAEYGVLQGAMKTLAANPSPTWFVEICLNEFHPGSNNPNFAKTFDLFWCNGYEARAASERGRLITRNDVVTWSRDGKTGLRDFNYLFIPAK